MMAWQMNTGMFVVRVPSKENLAVDPSRERYGLLAGMPNAKEVAPVLDRRFYDAQDWASLSITAHRPPLPLIVIDSE